MRMLADKLPALRPFTHSRKFEDIEVEIIGYFGTLLSDEDKQALSAARMLRNKILHCDFEAARNKLDELGLSPKRGVVRKAMISPSMPAEAIMQTIRAVAEGRGGVLISNTPGKAHANLFGWMMELAAGNGFVLALSAFQRAGAIIERLLNASDLMANS
ncbi:MAG: hypothetical protein WBB34_15135 [Xanthobacteraceae bacterium]